MMGRYTDLQSVTPKVDSPPRYLDTGSGGKILRPENQVAYNPAPSISAVRRALTFGGLMASSALPEPEAVALFSTDEYEFGGAPKVFANMFTTNYTPNDSATVAIVADEGLSVDFIGGGAATSASATLTATAGLEAIINPEVGFTGVIDVTPVFNDPAESIYLGPFFSTGSAGFGFDLHPIGGGAHQIAIRDGTSGANVYTAVVPAVVSGRKYRMAFSIKPNLFILSVDGASPVSHVPTVVLDLSVLSLKLYAAITGGVVGSYARISQLLCYPFIQDVNILKALSAQ